MRKRVKNLKVSCENVMEKLKFITFIDMFNNFSVSNFIWEYFFFFLRIRSQHQIMHFLIAMLNVFR
jgi:hypothetical protein